MFAKKAYCLRQKDYEYVRINNMFKIEKSSDSITLL